ncbi:YceI family protein [Flavitalea flava]
MNKFFLIIVLLLSVKMQGYCQLYMTRTGFAGFYSKTPLEDIIAENNQVYAVIDAGNKKMAFSGLLKGFVFKKELMQEHFNENYVESDKYPKTSFSGVYTGDIPLTANGVYKIVVIGDLKLHNVTKKITVPATLEVKDGRLIGAASFKLKPEDFNISIPSIVRDKIAGEMNIQVKIDCNTSK